VELRVTTKITPHSLRILHSVLKPPALAPISRRMSDDADVAQCEALIQDSVRKLDTELNLPANQAWKNGSVIVFWGLTGA
jgi:hypothetical protein